MTGALGVLFTILGLMAIARELAAAAPPGWKLGEFILLAAFFYLVRECIRFREAVKDIRSSRDPFAGSTPYTRAPEFEHATPDPGQATPDPPAAASEPKPDGGVEIRADDSVEKIAHVMVTQAFRRVSLKYHPDHGGDPEIMRRVYAAREMMLRAIRNADHSAGA
jgi:hypothetical protein